MKLELIAIDFDATIIDIHTGGRWDGTVDELKRHVRPEFSECLLQQQQLPIAIATFSEQLDLIRKVTGVDAVYGGNSWREAGKRVRMCYFG